MLPAQVGAPLGLDVSAIITIAVLIIDLAGVVVVAAAAEEELAPGGEGGEDPPELVEAGGVVPLVRPVLPGALQQLLEGGGRLGRRRGSGCGGGAAAQPAGIRALSLSRKSPLGMPPLSSPWITNSPSGSLTIR